MQTVIIDRPSGQTYDDDDSTASDNCTDDDSIIRINEWNNNAKHGQRQHEQPRRPHKSALASTSVAFFGPSWEESSRYLVL